MELLRQVSSAQVLYPVAAVAVVLICAALVFIFGFHSAEQPQFDKLPLVVDDRKSSSKKRKTKDKKSSPNRTANEDGKTKSESKKSPAKEKKEEKVKEAEKPKAPKPAEPKVVKKEATEAKKGKKSKVLDSEKPADFDDGLWEEVPKKSEKKKVKGPEDKKESPKKEKESPARKSKNAKKTKEVEPEVVNHAAEPVEEKIKISSISGPVVDEEAARALEAQIEEVQRILKEKERQEQAALGGGDNEEEVVVEELTEVKDLRSNKKKENKEKEIKEKQKKKEAKKPEPAEETAEVAEQLDEGQTVAPVFDELGDSWTDAKAPKKSKKKARKDQ